MVVEGEEGVGVASVLFVFQVFVCFVRVCFCCLFTLVAPSASRRSVKDQGSALGM